MNSAFQSRAVKGRFTNFLKNINGVSDTQDFRKIPKSKFQRNLVKYFGLQYKETEMVSMEIDVDELQPDRIILSVKYSTKTPFLKLKGIPFELSRVVASYIPPNRIQVKFAIYFPKDYPFVPPKWSLIEDLSNISDISNLIVPTEQYYQELVDTHNNQYKRSPDLDIDGSEPYPFSETCPHLKSRQAEYYNWSPSHCIEQDVLNFILRINHFEYILQDPDLMVEGYNECKSSYQTKKTQKKIYQPWRFVLQ